MSTMPGNSNREAATPHIALLKECGTSPRPRSINISLPRSEDDIQIQRTKHKELSSTFNSLLHFNPSPIVSTHSAVITKPACLGSLRWIHQKLSRAHLIQEVPDLINDLSADLFPFALAHHGHRFNVDVVVVALFLPIHSSITTIVAAANDVVTTAGNIGVRKDQFLECVQVNRNLNGARGANVLFRGADGEFVIVSHQCVVRRKVNSIDLTADFETLITNERTSIQD